MIKIKSSGAWSEIDETAHIFNNAFREIKGKIISAAEVSNAVLANSTSTTSNIAKNVVQADLIKY